MTLITSLIGDDDVRERALFEDELLADNRIVLSLLRSGRTRFQRGRGCRQVEGRFCKR